MPGIRAPEESSSTKGALVDVARRLFTDHGYAGTSLDAIVAGAEVTKGALYHHFAGKQALFEAVFVAVEARAGTMIREAVGTAVDPWEKAALGLRRFLEIVQQSDYRRVVVQEGPVVLGYVRFREQTERSTFGIVQDVVAAALAAYDLPPTMVETFSRVFFGALSAAGAAVSAAPDPEAASAEAEAAVTFMLAGLRRQAESGEALPALSAPR